MMFASLFSRAQLKKLFHEGTHPHPVRDWFVMVAVFAVLVGISVGWNMWTYVRTNQEEVLVSTNPHTALFDSAVVEAVQRAFEERTKEAERYRSTYNFVDPSL